ncbi:hypothetical protein ACSBR1_016789 [Camellia fascicularis]
MPYSLRRLFATILVHCAPEQSRTALAQIPRFHGLRLCENNKFPKARDIKKVLQSINLIIQSMGKNITDFNLCSN